MTQREEAEKKQEEIYKLWKARQDKYEGERDEIARKYIKERREMKPMTVGKLLNILSELPVDCTIASDSGWECDPTDIEQIWYIKEFNEVYFTQKESEYSNSVTFEDAHAIVYNAIKIYDTYED